MSIPRSHIALITSAALVLSVIGVFGLHVAFAGPTVPPPGNNVAAPLNQGADPQRKSGTLRLGSSSQGATALTVENSSPANAALSVLGSLFAQGGVISNTSVSSPLFCLTDDKCIRRWADGGGVSVPSSGSTTGLGWKVVGNGWEEHNGAISSTPLACEVSHWGGTGDNKASCDGNKYIVCPGTSDTPKTGAKVWLNQERVPTVRQHYLCLQKDSGTSATGGSLYRKTMNIDYITEDNVLFGTEAGNVRKTYTPGRILTNGSDALVIGVSNSTSSPEPFKQTTMSLLCGSDSDMAVSCALNGGGCKHSSYCKDEATISANGCSGFITYFPNQRPASVPVKNYDDIRTYANTSLMLICAKR